MRMDDFYRLTPGPTPLAADPLNSITGKTPRERLRQATQNFEAIFLSQLFASMRKTVSDGGYTGESNSENMYRALLDEQYALELARHQGTGLAEQLFRSLEKALPPEASLPNETEKGSGVEPDRGKQE